MQGDENDRRAVVSPRKYVRTTPTRRFFEGNQALKKKLTKEAKIKWQLIEKIVNLLLFCFLCHKKAIGNSLSNINFQINRRISQRQAMMKLEEDLDQVLSEKNALIQQAERLVIFFE